uniref:Uncharacterized protein n=1 Tax=Timema shepardi TaxID=629360 RepID=A0A7R9APH3_TIMSH|nr:unnamed protein product [Timema shepardi]
MENLNSLFSGNRSAASSNNSSSTSCSDPDPPHSSHSRRHHIHHLLRNLGHKVQQPFRSKSPAEPRRTSCFLEVPGAGEDLAAFRARSRSLDDGKRRLVSSDCEQTYRIYEEIVKEVRTGSVMRYGLVGWFVGSRGMRANLYELEHVASLRFINLQTTDGRVLLFQLPFPT